jgi:hypothetical protein
MPGSGGSGVTASDGLEAGPFPAELVPDTVNVYVVPFDRPPTVPVQVAPEHATPVSTVTLDEAIPTEAAVRVYFVTCRPLGLAAGLQVAVAC